MIVGKIVSIQFNQFRVRIFSNVKGGGLNIKGEIYYFGNIGSYLKTSNALGEDIVCEVIAIFDSDKQDNGQDFNLNSNRELLLKPIGIYKDDNFTLGISIYPSLYSDVSLLTNEDLKNILMPKEEHKTEGQGIYLGVSKNQINHPIYIQEDKFFGMHSAVLGNSGSGKSNTIAHLLQEIYKKEQPAIGSKVIIFDVNGEYSQAFFKLDHPDVKVKLFKPNSKENKNGAKPFYMPHFLLSLDEWCAFLMATDATQKPFWDKVLQEAYRFNKILSSNEAEEQKKFLNYLRYKLYSFANNILVQTENDTAKITTLESVVFRVKEIITNAIKDNEKKEDAKSLIEDTDNLLERCCIDFGKKDNEIYNILKQIEDKINFDDVNKISEYKYKDGEFFEHEFLKIAAEMILVDEETRGIKTTRGYVGTMLTRLDYFISNPECSFMREINHKNIKEVKQYLDYLWGKTQLIIIDASELGKDTLETLTSVISRLIFEYRKKQKGENRQKNPVHLVLDEAHRYIKKDQKYLLKDNVFERIAREGRKFSLYLFISSQRPSELSETVLSQCINFIIHRIQNENDMRHINAVLPYFSEDFVSKIKQSVPGEALVFGDFVPMPMHIKIQKADPEPHSSNCKISQEWYCKLK
ncbi:TPA: ATP-binding protein [Campylobacter coli]|uniref:ATP-binding protein n=1 Tax=Campylobacter coli TaxID=195 RepID=UPI002027BE11|nr:ATP-binding protein [Campylobacter coli]HEE9546274.1 ATP-binding protein [Campylobacter coli]HEG0331924.1 ATP-binding protein [Campylobacter coli]HEG0355706.1 ATP-binding protein [Campylobacter coli]